MTTTEHVKSYLKYAGPSVASAGAIAEILIFFMPSWQPIQASVALLLSLVINGALVLLWKR